MPITGPYPGIFNTAASEILVSHTTFSGSIINQGVIGTGGIVVIDSTFQSGGLTNTGTVLGGIHVDSGSQILAGGATAIVVQNTATFAGGITNTGTLSGTQGIVLNDVMNFSDGVNNTGAITAHFSAINIATNVTASGGTFTGNIVNSGTLRGASGLRIAVVASSGALNGSSTFNGSIVNTGSIFSSGRNGIHIEKVGAALFSGNISNGGALTATNDTAIAINLLARHGERRDLSGNIINSGAINSRAPQFRENFESGKWPTTTALSSATSSIRARFPPPMPTALKFNRSAARCSPGTSAQRRLTAHFGGLSILNVAHDSGTFDGSIGNAGTISAGAFGIQINAIGAALFSGSIANSGTINATSGPGLNIGHVADSSGTFNDSIVNTASISAALNGIAIMNVGAALFPGPSATAAPLLRRPSPATFLFSTSPTRAARLSPATSSTAAPSRLRAAAPLQLQAFRSRGWRATAAPSSAASSMQAWLPPNREAAGTVVGEAAPGSCPGGAAATIVSGGGAVVVSSGASPLAISSAAVASRPSAAVALPPAP
jgi:hypothetical protein